MNSYYAFFMIFFSQYLDDAVIKTIFTERLLTDRSLKDDFSIIRSL